MQLDTFTLGQIFETNIYRVTKEDVLRFAREFDPQYMHIDEEKAAEGRFNGIIASGIHTISITFKLWVETGMYGDDVVAGTEMNHIKFMKPVYPDDELRAYAEVTKIEAKKETEGILTVMLRTYNQKDTKVFESELSALIKR
ncbi:MaoC/PaaZ C-terminal domain-containing protein [Marinococcus halotolerans]|uniref:MaoC/PaaZ C-terminal domain-containing protein n=1 Tax=Marinococcus halotolerans TaxID=301092 RepID=UPI0003B392C0|nr:MaoC/PaaZ C-terminal domain-containing protein [Marinococcus halotolerans]